MVEVIKAFVFFASGMLLSEAYQACAWERYRQGKAESRTPEVELHGRRYNG